MVTCLRSDFVKLTISLEARFLKTPDEKIWSESGPDYFFWQRYLDVFDSVEVVARVQDVVSAPPSYKRADGERVMFTSLPCYIGPYQYLRNAVKVNKISHIVAKNAEAVLLRTPGQVSSSVFSYLRKKMNKSF